MKIFNWVHRKFNSKAENAKRNGDEKKPPAEDECDDVFERWRGGILAIGTFGFDPLKDKNEELITHDYFVEDDGDHSSVEDDDHGDGDGDGEGNPLVLAVHDCNAGELTETETETETEENDQELQFGFEYVMMKKKERITLADLFTADSGNRDPRAGAAIAKDRTFNESDLVREKSSRKHALSFTAKNARPIHKLNKLMRRMLRRKIHPDVGPINPKVAALNNYNCDYDYNYNYNDKCRGATDDYASLLPTNQDTII